jgi:hypothetical protein
MSVKERGENPPEDIIEAVAALPYAARPEIQCRCR